MAGGVDDHRRDVAKNVLIACQCVEFAAAADPVGERRGVGTGVGLGCGGAVPIALANQDSRAGEGRQLVDAA
jgi:hypothetical protein